MIDDDEMFVGNQFLRMTALCFNYGRLPCEDENRYARRKRNDLTSASQFGIQE